jgi:predicted XRE-type DNA-binding protein
MKPVDKPPEKFSPVGSGDIFKDFGFSEEESAALTIKACLFRKLQTALKEQPGTQMELGGKLNIPQSKISDILSGKMAGYSVERIVNLLQKLNYEISVDAHPAPAGTCARVVDLAEKKEVSKNIKLIR